MPCYHPLKAMRHSGRVQVLASDASIWNLRLPCGQCVGCRLDRSREWALRCMHEASLHADNCFITLTYSPENVPDDGGLHHSHFQRFMKRLRKRYPDSAIRYYMCGEYGESNGRPHFHCILFNFTFSDLVFWKNSPTGNPLFRSHALECLWPLGFSSVGAVTFDSAAYVARYVMKKVTGDASRKHYEVVSEITGEVIQRRPEYNSMSLKPGIGAGWFSKFRSDVFPHDRVIHDGTPHKPPRYYDKLESRIDSDGFADIKSKRVLDNLAHAHDNTYGRLAVKEVVTAAAISQLKRGINYD